MTSQLGTVKSQLGAIELGYLDPPSVAHTFTAYLGTARSWPQNIVPGFGSVLFVTPDEPFGFRRMISVP